MYRILRTLLMDFGVGVFNTYRRVSVDMLKIQAATAYLKGVQTVRRWWIGALLLAGVLLFLAAGFVIVHIGFFLWVPWGLATKAIVMTGLGLLYMVIALVVLFKICSEKVWMEGSQVNKLIEEATRKS